jgi:uncharacterized protein (DUF433 family)
MGGKPCLRGMRVTVGPSVGLVAAGHANADILAAYPYLEGEDIRQALAYAAWRVEEIDVPSCCMKLLIDMNLSPLWVRFPAEKGFDSVHWSSLGDLDFGALLPRRKTSQPSPGNGGSQQAQDPGSANLVSSDADWQVALLPRTTQRLFQPY